MESSTFGSEFVALRIATEKIIALRYKLRMFGVPLDGPAQVFSDSESVVKNSSNPESRINKKHLSCVYHKVRENIAAGTIIIFFESRATNIADILTKSLPPEKRKLLMNGIF